VAEPQRTPPWDEFPDKGSTWAWCLREYDELFGLMDRLGEALTDVLDVPHEEGCEYPRGGLYVCTRDCFHRAPEAARVTLVDYRKAKDR